MHKRQITSSAVKRGPLSSSNLDVFVKLRKTDSETITSKDNVITTNPPDGSASKAFEFTKVFSEDTPHDELFEVVAKPLLDNLIDNHKSGLLFAYGLSGSGKTYTMDGLVRHATNFLFDALTGRLLPKGTLKFVNNCYQPVHPSQCQVNDIIDRFEHRSKYSIFLSIVEVYLKSIKDMLTSKKIDAASYANQLEIRSPDEARGIISHAKKLRNVKETRLNSSSSRGHFIITFHLVDSDGKSSSFCMSDLAGSERSKASGVTGNCMQETCSINNSLGVLRQCVRALRDKRGVIPYRSDSLAMLFKNYFEKGSVAMILCVKPDETNLNENLFALEFGVQTREVKITPTSPSDDFHRALSELRALRRKSDNKLRNGLDKFKKMSDEFRHTILSTHQENLRLKASKNRFKDEMRTIDNQNERLLTKYEQRVEELLAENAYLKDKIHTPAAPTAPSPILTHSTDLTESTEFQTPSPEKLRKSTIPVVNPKHNRSLSCSSLQWIHHKPKNTIDTGTVLKPKLKNGRSVKKLRTSDILRRDAAGYSVVHQDADSNGEVETKIYKGQILTTVCGGAQVTFNDVETMRQTTPKGRERAASDAAIRT